MLRGSHGRRLSAMSGGAQLRAHAVRPYDFRRGFSEAPTEVALSARADCSGQQWASGGQLADT